MSDSNTLRILSIDGNDHLMNAMEYPILLGKNYARTKTEYDMYSKYNYNSQPRLI